MSLQEEIDYFNTHKPPDKTLFGDLQGLVPDVIVWKRSQEGGPYSGSNLHSNEAKKTQRTIDVLPHYAQNFEKFQSVKELLANLAEAMGGK